MFKNLRIILDKKRQKLVTLIFAGLVITGLLEMLGIGLLPSIVLALENSEKFIEKIDNQKLNFYFNNLNKGELLVHLFSFFFLIFLVKNILIFLLIVFENKIMMNLRVRISKRLMSKYLHSPYEFFLNKNTSTFLRNLQSEIANCTNYISAVLMLSRELLVIIFLLSLMLYQSLEITMIVLVIFTSITLLLYLTFKNKTSKVSHKSLVLREKIFRVINEFLTSIKDVKIFRAEDYVLNNFEINQQKLSDNDFYIKTLYAFPRLLLEVICIASILLFCSYFILNSSYEELLPSLTLLIILLIRFLPAFSSINQSLNRLRVLKISVDYIANELSNLSVGNKANNNDTLRNIESFNKEIIFNNVSYKYPNTKKSILNDINLTIKKGDFIGIIGKSGSGKTTLVNLLCGLLISNKGSIYVDNKDLHKHSIKHLIGYVPQDIYLLEDSIKQNIAFGQEKENIDENNVKRSLKISNLNSLFDEKGFDLESGVGSLGIKLSGGQKQRIGIARAIYKNAPIIIFDESTSSLDMESEKQLIEEINNLKKDTTIIFISHRISALKYCNKVFELKDGNLTVKKDYLNV